jgi:type IV fimbrial biogenesis protein FimT
MAATARGIGMIELLVILAIVTLLAGIAMPNLQQAVHRTTSESIITTLVRVIATGKAAAVTHGSIVSLCSLQLDATPAPSCRKGVWLGPLTLFTDHNGDSMLNGSDSVVVGQLLPEVPGSLWFRSFPAGRTALQFTAAGFTRDQTGNFLWCASSNDATTAHQLIFNNTGRTRLAQDRDGDGIRENASGKNLSCP